MTARRRRILEVTSYPPPRAGWGIRVEFLKKRLEQEGHECVVLNIGTSRRIPSPEYETVMSGFDFVRKVFRYARRGYTVHTHANGDSPTGALLAMTAQVISVLLRTRLVLTFHAGVIQRHFPRDRDRRLVPFYKLLFWMPERIICNSEPVKACIAGYGVDPAKIVPIPAFSRQYVEFATVPLPAQVGDFYRRYPHVVFTYVRMRPLFYPVTMIDGLAEVMRRRSDVGLVVCGGTGHADAGVWPAVQDAIRKHGVAARICFVDDLDHDAFLTALQQSALYLRTPITDGVASSVLESLAVGTPVVASENGTRPAGVLTYPAEDPSQMAELIEYVLANRQQVVASLGSHVPADTVADEVALLTS